MSAKSPYWKPDVRSADKEIDLEDVRDSLLENVPEKKIEEKNGHIQYSGSRFEFVFWGKSAIFRDHYQEKVSENDLYAWQEFANRVEEDLKYPPE